MSTFRSPEIPRLNRRTLIAGAGLVAAGSVVAPRLFHPAAAFAGRPSLTESTLGPAVTGMSFANGVVIGRELWIGSARMAPARVAAYDFDEGRVTRAVELPGVVGVWGMAFLGTDLYVATFTPGKLFRIDTVSGTITDEVALHEEVVWNVKVSPDGQVFAGTYPSAELWQYDPATGQATNHGRMSDETYVRDLAATESTVYCGIGAQPELIAFDRATGTTTNIMPSEWENAGLTFVSVLELSGPYLLAGTTPLARVAVINTQDHSDYTLVTVPNDEPFVVGLHGRDEDFYVGTTRSNTVWHGRIGSSEITPLATTTGSPLRMGHLDDDTLWVAQRQGATLIDIPTGDMTELNLLSDVLQADPQTAQTMHWADGRVFVPGSGQMAIHDDFVGGETVDIPVSGEVKDLTHADGMLYSGHYTLALFGMMPTDGDTLPTVGRIPPAVGQTRPHNVALDADHNRVLMASEPDYGGWEGALGWMDLDSLEVTAFRGILEDQSVQSVVAAPGGAIVGGSIYNGFGTSPTRQTAQLGYFSYEANAVTLIADEFPATTRVTDLRLVGHLLLALTDDGRMVGLNPETFEVHWTVTVGASGGRTTMIRKTVYGTDGQLLWALDLDGTNAPERRVLVEALDGQWWGTRVVTGDGRSTLFTMRGFDLVRIDLALPPLTLAEVRDVVTEAISDGRLRNPLAGQLTSGLEQAERHRKAGREAQATDTIRRTLGRLRSSSPSIDDDLREELVGHLDTLL